MGKNLLKVDLDLDADEVFLLFQKRARPRNDDDYEAVCYRAGPKLKAFIDSLRRDDPTIGELDLLAWEDEAA